MLLNVSGCQLLRISVNSDNQGEWEEQDPQIVFFFIVEGSQPAIVAASHDAEVEEEWLVRGREHKSSKYEVRKRDRELSLITLEQGTSNFAWVKILTIGYHCLHTMNHTKIQTEVL